MKNISKILGVLLTLALIAGLFVMALPAAAADEFAAAASDEWLDDGTFPPIVMDTTTNVFTVAADGTTMFMWTKTSTSTSKAVAAGDTIITVASTDGFPATGTLNVDGGAAGVAYSAKSPTTFTIAAGAAGTPAAATKITPGSANAAAVIKSTDAGITWSASNLSAPAAASITMLKVSPTDLTQLVAAGGNTLYRSVNGGKNWTAGQTFGTVIRSIDIAEGPDGTVIIVGSDTGVDVNDPALGAWNHYTTGVAGWVGGADVYSVALSPDYLNDLELLAVVNVGGNTQLFTKIDTGNWNADLAVATLKANNTDNITALTSACLAFPSDYSWGTNNQVFVGINDAALLAGDVYRVNGALAGGIAKVRATGAGANIVSLAVSGTKADSTVIASQLGSGIITSTDADTVSQPTWTADGIKNPVGTGPMLALASTGILYAGVVDAHSAFYSSTDFMSFNGISRFEMANIYTCGFSRGVLSEPGRNKFAEYMVTNAGNYEMRLAAATGFNTVPGGVRGSKVVYAVFNSTPKQIQKSIDGGLTWDAIASPGNKTITCLSVMKDDLYWIGYTGKIRSNTGSEIDLAGVAEDPSSIDAVGNEGLLVGAAQNAARVPATWLFSEDSGVSFSVLGTQDKWTSAIAGKFAVAERTILIIDNAGSLWTWSLGANSSTAWEKQDALKGIPAADLTKINKVDRVSGVTFITVKDTTGTGNPQIYRSLPGRFDFRPMPDSDVASIGGQVDGISIYDNNDTTFNIKPTLKPINEPYPPEFGTSKGKLYQDTTFGPLTLTSPADKAALNNPVDLAWSKSKISKVDYEYEVARDAEFDLVVASASGFTNNTTVLGVGPLETGITYYWHVRINNTGTGGVKGTLNGFWSDPRTFTVKTIGNNNPVGISNDKFVSPAQGAVNVSSTPVLTWGVVEGATYNVKVATDSAFTNVVDSKDGLTVAVYSPSKALDANKTYYWEVQAVSNGIPSDWVAFAFTTAAAPTPTGTGTATAAPTPIVTVVNPTPIVTVTIPPTTPVAPATPAYIWFIIVIGAVLVIAVIVLIVRTRRV